MTKPSGGGETSRPTLRSYPTAEEARAAFEAEVKKLVDRAFEDDRIKDGISTTVSKGAGGEGA